MKDANINRLGASALKIKMELSLIKNKDAILVEATQILEPLISLAIEGRVSELPDSLPRPQFFYGMQEDTLAAWHLDKTELLNAITEVGASLNDKE
jgi:hypothetical protein